MNTFRGCVANKTKDYRLLSAEYIAASILAFYVLDFSIRPNPNAPLCATYHAFEAESRNVASCQLYSTSHPPLLSLSLSLSLWRLLSLFNLSTAVKEKIGGTSYKREFVGTIIT